MTPDEARTLLGVGPDDPIRVVVDRYRELQRRHHPDVAVADDDASTAISARLNLALAVLRAEAAGRAHPSGPRPAPGPEAPFRDVLVDDPDGEPGPLELRIDGDSLFLTAPPDETFLRLLEAGAGLGGIGHVDPRLGLLELVVRFEGGPTCSVLLTLQGRSHGTEVFCEMESIEAGATPPLAPVLEALVAELVGPLPHPRPGPTG